MHFSLFNIMEVMAVIEFIKNLLSPSYTHFMKISQSDIGVVTPYKMQRRKIAQACHRFNFDGITIGRKNQVNIPSKVVFVFLFLCRSFIRSFIGISVMIVSIVRFGGNRLGFVNNARVSN